MASPLVEGTVVLEGILPGNTGFGAMGLFTKEGELNERPVYKFGKGMFWLCFKDDQWQVIALNKSSVLIARHQARSVLEIPKGRWLALDTSVEERAYTPVPALAVRPGTQDDVDAAAEFGRHLVMEGLPAGDRACDAMGVYQLQKEYLNGRPTYLTPDGLHHLSYDGRTHWWSVRHAVGGELVLCAPHDTVLPTRVPKGKWKFREEVLSGVVVRLASPDEVQAAVDEGNKRKDVLDNQDDLSLLVTGHAEANGTYMRTKDEYHDRPVFQRQGGGVGLFHDGSRWLVARLSDAVPIICCPSFAPFPTLAREHWTDVDGNKLVDVSVSALAKPPPAPPPLVTKKSRSRRSMRPEKQPIMLEGLDKDDKGFAVMGMYGVHKELSPFNERPLYTRRNERYWLFYDGKGSWRVEYAVTPSERRLVMKVDSDALLPTDIEDQWKMARKDALVGVDGIVARFATDEDREERRKLKEIQRSSRLSVRSTARSEISDGGEEDKAPAAVIVAGIPGSKCANLMGTFTLREQPYKSLPVYVKDTLWIFHDGRNWVLKDIAKGHTPLRIPSDARLPTLVEGTWLLYDREVKTAVVHPDPNAGFHDFVFPSSAAAAPAQDAIQEGEEGEENGDKAKEEKEREERERKEREEREKREQEEREKKEREEREKKEREEREQKEKEEREREAKAKAAESNGDFKKPEMLGRPKARGGAGGAGMAPIGEDAPANPAPYEGRDEGKDEDLLKRFQKKGPSASSAQLSRTTKQGEDPGVVVCGIEAGEVGSEAMGYYAMLAKCNGRPAYKRMDFWLFYDGLDWALKCGLVQPSAKDGRSKLVVYSSAQKPTQVDEEWTVFDPADGAFKPCPDVVVRTATEQDKSDERDLREASVVMEGVAEGEAGSDLVGLYQVVPGHRVNHRQVYKRGAFWLVHEGDQWRVVTGVKDPAKDKGQTKAFLKADTVMPFLARGTWSVRHGVTFGEVKELTLRMVKEEEVERLRKEHEKRVSCDLFVSGVTEGPAVACMGIFKNQKKRLHSRPVYRNHNYWLYHDGREWCVRNGSEEHSAKVLLVSSEALTPMDVVETWVSYYDGDFRDNPNLEIREATHEDLARKEKEASSDVVVEGVDEGQPGWELMGLYSVQSGKFEKRPVYKNEDFIMFFDGESWCVKSGIEEPSTRRGRTVMYCMCDVPKPNEVTEEWVVNVGGNFKDMENVKVRLATRHDNEAEGARREALEKELRSDVVVDGDVPFAGLYTQLPAEFSGKGVYAHEADVLFYDGEGWCVKSGVEDLDVSYGTIQMRAVGNVPAPTRVVGPWLVFRGDDVEESEGVAVRVATEADYEAHRREVEWREKEATLNVIFEGADPNDAAFETMGVYWLQDDPYNDRPCYQNSKFVLRFEDEDGRWVVVPRKGSSKSQPALYAASTCKVPSRADEWKAFRGDRFRTAEEIQLRVLPEASPLNKPPAPVKSKSLADGLKRKLGK